MTKGNKCDNCGKGIMYGHNVSHAKNRTRRIFKPNLHKAKIAVGSVYKTMKLCTKCLRLLKGKTQKKEVKVEPQEASEQPQVIAAV
ncbi:MAG: 50S ribosomal protein L28 [Candidatus Levybacteria bacterium RIFCSPLOWO2_01_FULL_36_13]|nr:MAG: 50S ribosomal protein L28 [Candidatus Levybacteria bacterium RIFCSPHIGHO2_01_FULL_36_15b]OGH35167.1 MAG: 50S ribosomal protein L28 [Candidatus Levybacteria bacterium RIFCSPLOWO2_01_FULL_36_13]